jgi:hypothetical protein
MKRNLIAAVLLSLCAGAALADNGYVFDDPYWKRAEIVSAQPMAGEEQPRSKYDAVDNYNP